MPGFDGTGPYGDGRPGRGLGPCGRFGRPYGYGFGYGRGRGFRGGMGWRNRWNNFDVPYYPEETDFIQPYNKESLKLRKRELEKELKWLEDEIKELDQEKK